MGLTNNRVLVLCLSISVFIFLFASCSKDKLEAIEGECPTEITYLEDMREVIDLTCAYSGCHDGVTAPGNYRTYDAMVPYLSGDLEELLFRRVIEERDMPPTYAEGQRFLTQEQLDLFICWRENNYTE